MVSMALRSKSRVSVIGSLFTAFVLLYLCCSSAYAIKPRANLKNKQQSESIASQIAVPVVEDYDTLFLKALNLVTSNEQEQAKEKLSALRKSIFLRGYRGAPEFSVELLKKAQQYRTRGRYDVASFLISMAIEFSPQDPRILFSVVSFYDVIGYRAALKSASDAMLNILDYPLVLSTVFLNILLTGLVALTVSLLFVLIVQILRNGEQVFNGCCSIMPLNYRAYLGIMLMFLVLLLPMFAGIGVAIAVWAVLLTRAVARCNWCGIFTATLFVLWGLAIPFIERASLMLSSEQAVEVGALARTSLISQADQLLMEALVTYPEDPQLLYLYAQQLYYAGKIAESETTFMRARELAEESRVLVRAINVNLAAINYLNENYAVAKSLLDKAMSQGEKSFEFYHNFALVSLALLDTVAHREYTRRALELDPNRVIPLKPGTTDVQLPCLQPIPPVRLFPLILKGEGFRLPGAFVRTSNQNLLASALVARATPWLLVSIGLLVLLLSRKKRRRSLFLESDAKEQSNENGSFVWMLVPAGFYIAGGRPMLGAFVLSVVVGLFIAAYEFPLSLLRVLPIEVSMAWALNIITGTIIVVVLVVSLIARKQQTEHTQYELS